ncbi:MAG TPA: glycoside hydrolase family 9 protein, partial [Chryseosolibacter sp.]|nr:glycoside hydrolase family 9 protein [Chryseosolibacter sp.]
MKRINFYSISIAVFSLLMLVEGVHDSKAQRLSRDLNVDLLVNQVGYLPQSGKLCVVRGITNKKFDVIDLQTQKIVYTGVLKPGAADFGEYAVGDFSELEQEGHYYLKSDTLRSYPFAISKSVYQQPMNLIARYFSLQRCGSSNTGYLSPCHIDDGIRIDNAKHQDVTGGWHDASDLRKWVGATIYGVIGLAKAYESGGKNSENSKNILEELLWGNQYFLKMQEPQGYVMSFIGGDVRKHSDSNRWTDNEIGEDGGDLKMVRPSAGKSTNETLVFGSIDDRVIETKPLDIIGQFNFVTAEAMMARITKTADAGYSGRCLRAAAKCFEWSTKSTGEANPGVIGASILASLEMYKTTNQDIYKNFAIQQASRLAKLQANTPGVSGFFYTSPSDQKPYKDIWHGCLEFISLCDLVQAFPAHKDGASWKQMIAKYSTQYLLFMSQKNSFGLIPFGLYSEGDPGGNRKAGSYWYRYFMEPDPTWWVGINSNIASAGVGLIKAARILNDPRLKTLAQRQLDWIVGVNPFNSSTIAMVGYNHPKHFPGSSFSP